MDNSLTLARHFARLVWLLNHQSQSKGEQKAALRAVAAVTKETSVRLGTTEGRLTVNGLVMPQALAGVRELAERLTTHAVEVIDIEEDAAAGELLALARLLASGAATGFAGKVQELEGKTVRVRLAAPTVPPPAGAIAAAAVRYEAPVAAADRARQLWRTLAGAPDAASTQRALEEIGTLAEQATREGRTTDTADTFEALLDYEAKVENPDVRRTCALEVRRLTVPTILRPVARLLGLAPERSAQIERILERCGQDGVDAVVDQYLGATTSAQRASYRDVLGRLTAAPAALTQMLSDPRWYVARQAADFLGQMEVRDAEHALADLLRHQDERVRRAATRALGRIDTPFTLDALARALGDGSALVRLEAVAAIAARKGARAGSTLASVIDREGDREVQFSILAALGRVGTSEAVAKLSTAAAAATGFFASKKNSALRIGAIAALGDARTPNALAALRALANDREKDVRDAVARTLRLAKGTSGGLDGATRSTPTGQRTVS